MTAVLRSARRIARVAGPLALLLAAALPSDAGERGVLPLSIDYPGGEGDMPAHLYVPDGPGPYPGILVLHTSAGPGPNLEAFARRLAGDGFVTMTPDLFSLHDFGPDSRADHPLVLKDLEGALGFLRAHRAVDPTRIGVVGFSFGGRLAVLAAAADPLLRAVVVFYAVASYQELAKERLVPPHALATRPLTELVASIHAPILIHHGEADRSVPVSQGILLHRALALSGKPSTLYLYPGAGHLFDFQIAQEGASAYDPEAARLSWGRTLGFLTRHLSAH